MSAFLVTLSMIVKDEEATLARTLASARPFVDRWVILDTGSTDGTREVIRQALAGVPGELHEEPFADFATTRNRALDLAGTATPFALWLDADDELTGGAALRAFLEEERAAIDPSREVYFVRVEMGVRFDSPRVLRTGAGWRFQGAVHETLMHPGRPPPVHRVPGVIIRHEPGAGSVERSRRRWERDAVLLEAAVERDPRDARSAFYLAQTYLWLGRYETAEAAFARRIALGGWAEEIYESRVALVRIATARGAPWPEIEARWLEAHAFAPHRAEPLHAIAQHHDALGQHALTYLFARRGAELPLPVGDRLFVDEEVYAWKLSDLVGTSAYWLGEYAVGEAAARRAVHARPGDTRLVRNLNNYLALNFRRARELALEYQSPPRARAPETTAAGTGRIPYPACPLCDAREMDEAHVADCMAHPLYKPGLPPAQRWVRCRACAHVFVDGYFSEEALALLFSASNPGQIPGQEVEASRYVSARIVEGVAGLRPWLGGRWLDVGFGNGSLLSTAAEFGWEVVGIDRRPESVRLMTELGFEAHDVELGDYRPEARFDVVSMADVLEHMTFPRAALCHAWQIMNEGGLLFLSMPNSDCHLWQIFEQQGTNPYWAELEHLHNFGRRRLYRLLDECGFVPRRYAVSQRYRACMEVIAERRSAAPLVSTGPEAGPDARDPALPRPPRRESR